MVNVFVVKEFLLVFKHYNVNVYKILHCSVTIITVIHFCCKQWLLTRTNAHVSQIQMRS